MILEKTQFCININRAENLLISIWFPEEVQSITNILFKCTMGNGSVCYLLFSGYRDRNTSRAVSTGQECESVLPLNATNSFVGKYASYLKKTVSDWHREDRWLVGTKPVRDREKRINIFTESRGTHEWRLHLHPQRKKKIKDLIRSSPIFNRQTRNEKCPIPRDLH